MNLIAQTKENYRKERSFAEMCHFIVSKGNDNTTGTSRSFSKLFIHAHANLGYINCLWYFTTTLLLY